MALKTFVKISEVNNLSDARYCAGMTVNLMGFSIDKNSPSYASPANFMELTGWLSGVDFVGEFGNATVEEIRKELPEYELQYIQTDKAEIISKLKDFDQKIILRFNVDTLKDGNDVEKVMDRYSEYVSYYLFESVKGIQYKEHILNQVLDLATKYSIIIGFNISDENVLQLVQESNIKGISLKGGEEIRPGFKDFDELADILETLEIDDTLE